MKRFTKDLMGNGGVEQRKNERKTVQADVHVHTDTSQAEEPGGQGCHSPRY